MISISAVNNNFENYSSTITNDKAGSSKKEEETKEKGKQIITIKEGKFYAKYLVDDDGIKTLLCKIPVEEEDKKDRLCDLKSSTDKKYTEFLEISGEYKENIRNATDKIEQKNNDIHDNIKEVLKMIS